VIRLSVRRPGALVLMAALALATRGAVASAQDSSLTVRIGLTFTPGTRPGVLILPVAGSEGDSIRAILQRDLDFSDRLKVIARNTTIPCTPVWAPPRWCT
jgi:TolB protein